MKPLCCLLLLLSVSSIYADVSGPAGMSRRAAGDTEISFQQATADIVQILGAADRMEVYEGLPNPFGEKKLFEAERGSMSCRQIAGEFFYAKPQAAKIGDPLEFRRLVEAGFLKPWRGPKACGGFHADYALALGLGKKTIYVFFCFGCHEAKIISQTEPFGGDIHTADFQLTTDLNQDYFEAWRTRLTAYRKERPARVVKPSGR